MSKNRKLAGLGALVLLLIGVGLSGSKVLSKTSFKEAEIERTDSSVGVISYGFAVGENANKAASKITDLTVASIETAVANGIVDGVVLGAGPFGIHDLILNSAKKIDSNNSNTDPEFDHIVMRLQVELYERDLLSPNDPLGVYDLYETIPISENERSLLVKRGDFPASAWAEVVFRYVYDNGARVHIKDQSGQVIVAGDLDSSVELYYKLKLEVKACLGKGEMADCGPYLLIYELKKGGPLFATTVLKPEE